MPLPTQVDGDHKPITRRDGHKKKNKRGNEHRPAADLLCLTSPPLCRAWEAGATASGRAQCTSTQTHGTEISQAMAGHSTQALKDRICATASSQTTPYAVRRAVAFLLLSFFLQLCFEIRCLPSTPKCTCLAKTYLTHVLYLTAVSC